jgi:hypothetical protein
VGHRVQVGVGLSRLAAVVLALALAGCRQQPIEPLILDGRMLTVNNQTPNEWTGVDIWLNRNHRVMIPSIAAGGRLQVPLDSFVAGFGQRFDPRRTQVTDVRLTATLPDGSRLELQMPFRQGGLAGAFGGKR